MAGYLIIGGSMKEAWETVEQYAVPKEEMLHSGYGLILSKEENGKQYTVRDMDRLIGFTAEAVSHEKYCVIPEAHLLSSIVQNKLLKLLEDSTICFFLLADSEYQIIPTVKSRLICIRLNQDIKETSKQIQTLFINLEKRIDLFERMHLKEKDTKHMFYGMNVPAFFSVVEDLFLTALGYMLWNETGQDKRILTSLTTLWNSQEDLIGVCRICEEYLKKKHITKDDIFIFVTEIVEI